MQIANDMTAATYRKIYTAIRQEAFDFFMVGSLDFDFQAALVLARNGDPMVASPCRWVEAASEVLVRIDFQTNEATMAEEEAASDYCYDNDPRF